MDVVAMGVAGFLLVPWRDTTQLVLTPPAFRNPSVWRFLLFWDWIAGTSPDTAMVARRLRDMPAAGPDRLARVRAVFAGHAHYDHLMDLPAMARWLPNARVYGSSTVVNLLAGSREFRVPLDGSPRLVAIDTLAGSGPSAPGVWAPAERTPFRFKAVTWQHARNFPGISFAKGEVRKPQTGLPRTAAGWRMGPIYAYALDLLRADSTIALRILFQDAAAAPLTVTRSVSIWALDPAPLNIAIVSAANYDRVKAYPDTLIDLVKPQHLVLGHWEEFFRSAEKPLRVVRGIKGRDLVQRLESRIGNRWTALSPGATLRLIY